MNDNKGTIACPLHRAPREGYIRLSDKTGRFYYWCPTCGPVIAHGIDRAGGDDPDDFQTWIFDNGRFYGAKGDSYDKAANPRAKRSVPEKDGRSQGRKGREVGRRGV